MDCCLRLIVYRDNTIFDDVIVKPNCVLKYDRSIATSTRNAGDARAGYVAATRLCRKGLISCLVSTYIVTLTNSYVYRKNALRVLLQWLRVRLLDREGVRIICVRLRAPWKQFLDYKWNEKLLSIVLERQEADHALSWLSTLGGAFSALGEEFQHCAEMAGKISMRQFELALRLDNPLLVARCRLYSALSLIQRGHLRTPRYIVKKIYKFALEKKDMHLQNMCHGVWAKLQYTYKQYKQLRKSSLSEISRISLET